MVYHSETLVSFPANASAYGDSLTLEVLDGCIIEISMSCLGDSDDEPDVYLSRRLTQQEIEQLHAALEKIKPCPHE